MCLWVVVLMTFLCPLYPFHVRLWEKHNLRKKSHWGLGRTSLFHGVSFPLWVVFSQPERVYGHLVLRFGHFGKTSNRHVETLWGSYLLLEQKSTLRHTNGNEPGPRCCFPRLVSNGTTLATTSATRQPSIFFPHRSVSSDEMNFSTVTAQRLLFPKIPRIALHKLKYYNAIWNWDDCNMRTSSLLFF